MMELNDVFNSGGITGAILMLIVGGRYIVRRLARDSVEVAKDRAEVDILELYKAEVADLRLRLQVADKLKEEAISKVYTLTAEISALRTQVDMLKRELTVMHEEVSNLSKMLGELTIGNRGE